MDSFSFLSSIDGQLIEQYYHRYIKNPNLVDEGWRNFFKGFDFARHAYSKKPTIPKNVKTTTWKDSNNQAYLDGALAWSDPFAAMAFGQSQNAKKQSCMAKLLSES